MKRTVPLLITALGGFVLIVAYFIPAAESWGETTAIWFDILAAIAFILGGGNLLKVHLKKVSDRVRGWGYSAVIVLAFLLTLFFGLFKIGADPAPNTEFYGWSFAPLPLESLPIATIPGTVPERPDDEPLPRSVRRQLSSLNGQLLFRGWMTPMQRSDLIGYSDDLLWRCTVERLYAASQPPPRFAGLLAYYPDHRSLAWSGVMSPEQQQDLLTVRPDNDRWSAAVEQLAESSRFEISVPVREVPPGLNIPADLADRVQVDDSQLAIAGPMSEATRRVLATEAAGFQQARPLNAARVDAILEELDSRGDPLTEPQREVVRTAAAAIWSETQLIDALNGAGLGRPSPKPWCDVLAEVEAGADDVELEQAPGEDVQLNGEQLAAISRFAADESQSVRDLSAQLESSGDWTAGQQAALTTFFSAVPTVATWQRYMAFELLRTGMLSAEQRNWLLDDYRLERQWQRSVETLFVAAHQPKYPWSGDYSQVGSPFWWLYEYVFRPLTTTMFALLAFYVASAAFRAFRAKNIEAILLLGTAFIVLLGRTFAGVWLTSWLPEDSVFRIENMTVYIMSVLNTAGNRAIMIGIALGVVATSLKVLLGVDRSYLGSDD